MTRSHRVTIVRIVILILVLGMIGCGVWYFLSENKNIETLYSEKVSELENIIAHNTRTVFCTAEDLKAGTIIDDSNLVETSIITDRTGYLDTIDFGKVLLVDVPKGTELTKVMVSGNAVDTALREIEYNWLDITSNIENYDYVDVRILYPDGTDYVVLGKKQIKNLSETKLVCSLWNSEEELLLLDSASVDAFLFEGTRIYVTKYIVPAVQEKSIANYVPSEQTIELIKENPNIMNIASEYLSEELRKKYEERITNFYNVEEILERFDSNGMYAGSPTDADIYAEDILGDRRPVSGSELPKEYGGKLWD